MCLRHFSVYKMLSCIPNWMTDISFSPPVVSFKLMRKRNRNSVRLCAYSALYNMKALGLFRGLTLWPAFS